MISIRSHIINVRTWTHAAVLAAIILCLLPHMASAQSNPQPVNLSPYEQVDGLNGSSGQIRMFRVVVPTGQAAFAVATDGGSGDVDLYVRHGSPSTTLIYDEASQNGGNQEAVGIPDPAPGEWYVMLKGDPTYSGVSIMAAVQPHSAATVTNLTNGQPRTGIASDQYSLRIYKIAVPVGRARLEIRTSGGQGNVDMLVLRGEVPSFVEHDRISTNSGNTETVVVQSPQSGDWYIGLWGTESYSGVVLSAVHSTASTESITEIESNVVRSGIAGSQSSEQQFRITVPTGQKRLVVRLFGGNSNRENADIYVQSGSPATRNSYRTKSTKSGNDEVIEILNPAAGNWYVLVRGHREFDGVSLVATHVDALTMPVLHGNESHLVRIRPYSGSGLLPGTQTWLVIHGRDASPTAGYMRDLGDALASQTYNGRGQLAYLDWSTTAASSVPFALYRNRFDRVGQAASTILKSNHRIAGDLLDIAGHSWGTYVGNEVARRIKSNRFVALDPANSVSDMTSFKDIDFKKNSKVAWAFLGRGVFTGSAYGSQTHAGRADASFVLTFPASVPSLGLVGASDVHNGVVTQYAKIIKDHAFGGRFQPSQMPGRAIWTENVFNGVGTTADNIARQFEGVFDVTLSAGIPLATQFKYTARGNSTITAVNR